MKILKKSQATYLGNDIILTALSIDVQPFFFYVCLCFSCNTITQTYGHKVTNVFVSLQASLQLANLHLFVFEQNQEIKKTWPPNTKKRRR